MRRLIWIFFFLGASPSLAFEMKVGASMTQFDYREIISGSGKSHEAGWFPALEVGARWEPPAWNGGALSLDWTSTYNARTTYYGTNLATGSDITDRDVHTFHRFEGTFEHKVSEIGTFYVGLSYDRWDRFLAYGTGYREIYQWWTLPVGARFPLVFHRGSWLLIDLAARPMIAGSMRAIFSETFAGGEDSDFTLGNELGFRIRLPYEFYGDGWRFNVGPWFETYRFGASGWVYNATPGIQQNMREPASETVKTGISFILKILF